MAFDRFYAPNYPIAEAAYFLSIKPSTLATWVKGRKYRTQQGTRFSRPLIKLDDPDGRLMSFANLVEAHVLSALRREEKLQMPVMVDPEIGFGRLISTETGIPVDALIGRYDAGDSLEELAEDYGYSKEALEKAIFWDTAA